MYTVQQNIPQNVPPQTHVVEESPPSHMGLIVISILLFFIIIVIIVMARSGSSFLSPASHQQFEPHVIHIPPNEASIATGQTANQLSYPLYAPYAIAPNAGCVPGSNNYPVCIFQTPVEPWATGDPNCVAGSNFFPLCKITSAFPLPSYSF